MSGDLDRAAVAAALARAGGAVQVDAVKALSGGAASATYAVDATRDGTHWPLILQTRATGSGIGSLKRSVQAAIQTIARAKGLPVAEVVTVLEPGDGLGEGFVMERIEGESLAPRYLRQPDYAVARAAMTGQCAAALAHLHAIPLTDFAGLDIPAGSPRDQLERSYELYRGYGQDLPAFDLAFAWLRERLPADPPRGLVHGDFRSGNFIVGPEGLRAILDWEIAHFGHPYEDLGWLCVNAWRFGNWRQAVGGFGDREALYSAYEAAGGPAVDRSLVHVFEVLGTLRWGMSCLHLVDDHLSGRVRSVERATIGRRVSENEVDLLYLLKHGSI